MVNKLKRVLLVNPPAKFPQSLNIGLGWLASNLVDATEDVHVLAFANICCGLSKAEKILHDKVISYKPDIVGFNIHCTTYVDVVDMITHLRGYYKGIVVVGGPHTMYERGLILEKCPGADIVIMGEAEVTFAEVCRRPSGEYDGIEGVIFRNGDDIVENPMKSLKREFGNLKYPDYRKFGIKQIFFFYPISTSRGCPFNCSFCNPYMSGRHWRERDLEDVFDELSYARRTFGIRSFVVTEPVFNFKPDRVIAFCDELLKRGIDLPWYNSSGLRADLVTAEMIRSMKRAGCTHIKIGVETLVPSVFKDVNKSETIDDIKKAVAIIKSEGMRISGSFIIGLPHDTMETVRLNYELSQELGFDDTEWSLLIPYPGTKAYEWMEKNGRIYHSIESAHQNSRDLDGSDIVNVACDTPEFTKEERIRAFWEINVKSGNYIFSQKDPDWLKTIRILKMIIRYDRSKMLSHIGRLLKLLKRRSSQTGRGGIRFEFDNGTF